MRYVQVLSLTFVGSLQLGPNGVHPVQNVPARSGRRTLRTFIGQRRRNWIAVSVDSGRIAAGTRTAARSSGHRLVRICAIGLTGEREVLFRHRTRQRFWNCRSVGDPTQAGRRRRRSASLARKRKLLLGVRLVRRRWSRRCSTWNRVRLDLAGRRARIRFALRGTRKSSQRSPNQHHTEMFPHRHSLHPF